MKTLEQYASDMHNAAAKVCSGQCSGRMIDLPRNWCFPPQAYKVLPRDCE